MHALKGVDFDLNGGECVALLGENGAGKSTLIKVLGGAHQPDEGSLEIDGQPMVFEKPTDSLDAGIAIIYQEFNLVPGLSVAENVFLGMEPNDFGWVRMSEQKRRVEDTCKRIGANLSPSALCEDLTVAERQLVEIAKALVRDARVLVMDEPSAALTKKEVEQLYLLVDDLKSKGIGIVYVSHRLEEVERLADRAVVMRDGERVGELGREELDRRRIIELMVGRSMDQEFPAHRRQPGRSPSSSPWAFQGRQSQKGFSGGESGRDRRPYRIGRSRQNRNRPFAFRRDERESGEIELDGNSLSLRTPRDAIEAGVCLLTEDRKDQGLVLGLSVRENFGLPNLESFSRRGWIDERREGQSFSGYVDKIMIKVSGPNQSAGQLSGGNQQKVVLAKWLERNAEILIFDEPTRGIDVGAKYEIYQWMNQLADQGKGILMISSELPEVLGMSDRILVMKEGELVGEVSNGNEVTQESLMAMAIGANSGN